MSLFNRPEKSNPQKWHRAVWCWIFKKSMITTPFDIDIKVGEDVDFLKNNLKNNLTFGYITPIVAGRQIGKPLYRYRTGRQGSLSNPI